MASADVSKQIQEALMYHMKQQAIRDCDATAKAYADCASGRVFSVVWACRKQFGDLNNCLKTRTTEERLQRLKDRYIDAGSPSQPDWPALLKDL